jgi:hypothetical protein
MTPELGYARPGRRTIRLVQFNQEKFPDVAKKTQKKEPRNLGSFFIVLQSVVQIMLLK